MFHHISKLIGPWAIRVILRFVRLEKAKELCIQFGEAYLFKDVCSFRSGALVESTDGQTRKDNLKQYDYEQI